MIVNKNIKKTLNDISLESVKYTNTKDIKRSYNRRLLKIFKEQLSEDEQLYIMKAIFENLYFKNIVTDPDNVLTLHTIRLKNTTYIFFMVIVIIITLAVLFKTNETLNTISTILSDIFKLLSM